MMKRKILAAVIPALLA
ncbi:hypothetical protein CFSAN001078_03711, partial [Salmonella enterica subsp. enterica serovar Manhattan str. CFSAN001078]